LLLRSSAFLRQEPGADWRPCHQYRRDRPLSRHRRSARRRAAQGRPLELRHRRGACWSGAGVMPQETLRPNARILLVEDEESLVTLLGYNLEKSGYRVESVTRGDEAELRIAEEPPDLVLLDWMVPGVSGVELCRRLRAKEETARLPIIMLTARGEEADRVRGLTTGADDYVVKPFSVPELLARIAALLRRSDPAKTASVLSVGDLELDREACRVRRGGEPVHVGPTEYRLLEFLMLRPGRVFSREQLLDHVWGRDTYIDERTVDVHIGRLRKALSRPGQADPIRTVRGVGYGFDETFGTSLSPMS